MRSKELINTEIVHLLTSGEAPYAERELTEHFRVNSFFISKNVRDGWCKSDGNHSNYI